MSTPLNTDAVNTAIKPGAQAVLITEYMPGGKGCQVINTATTGTVYVGTSSGVGPSTGVPVPAGSSVQWTAPGEMWAVAGPDVVSTITLVTTALVSNWSPSPEVVGAIIAEQLLANGIPNVMTEVVIGDFVLPPTGLSIGVDVSGYASIVLIEIDNPGANPVAMNYNFFDVGGTAVIAPDQWTNQLGAPVPIAIPVVGPRLSLGIAASDPASTHTVRIIGSNRPLAVAHALGQGYSSAGYQAWTGNTVMAAGTDYPMSLVFGQQFQGPAFAEMIVTGTTVKGTIVAQWETAGLQGTIDYGDTTEMHTIGTDQHLYRTIAFLPVRFTLLFRCSTAGTANAVMRAIPQS